jgi:transglutaminase-like putative cysteine protease
MGINFREGISPNNLQPVITFLQGEAILTETKAIPKLPASLAGVPTNLTDLNSIYSWICTNIHYQFYYNSLKTVQEVLATKYANCDDQAILAITWLTALGYKCQKRHLEVTESDCNFSGGHYDVLVWINNQWVIWDTVCRGLSQIKG